MISQWRHAHKTRRPFWSNLVGPSSDHGDGGMPGAKPRNSAVSGEDIRGDVLGCTTHDWHLGAHTELVDIVGTVGLAKDAVHVVAEVIELETEVKVGEAVVLSDTVVVDAGVLLADGHHIGHDVKDALELHPDSVGGRSPGDGQPRHSGGLPDGTSLSPDVDGCAVEGQLEAVDVVVPLGGLLGTHVEAVVGEADAEGLDPGEVAAHGRVALADEVGVDVEVGVGDDAEVLVLLSVKIEVVAVTTGEAWITAGDTRVEVAHCNILKVVFYIYHGNYINDGEENRIEVSKHSTALGIYR
ncbi:hypothetical protein PR202_gb00833 [Eleusine coracana subsp. coracana]|uniref:Uncharacterized protein n=1 Tax=Eleusine coracana subsp. coracana TaxID=191504 RepID=A0AAV5DUC4_ELECO|nr:hypothetical protein PR202_gb00833 [Eleusine coracana subsp. coracana]